MRYRIGRCGRESPLRHVVEYLYVKPVDQDRVVTSPEMHRNLPSALRERQR